MHLWSQWVLKTLKVLMDLPHCPPSTGIWIAEHWNCPLENHLETISDPTSITSSWSMCVGKAMLSQKMTVLRKRSFLPGHSLGTKQDEKVGCPADLFWEFGISLRARCFFLCPYGNPAGLVASPSGSWGKRKPRELKLNANSVFRKKLLTLYTIC